MATEESQPIRRKLSGHPSRRRLHDDLRAGKASKQALINRFDGDREPGGPIDDGPTDQDRRERQVKNRRENWAMAKTLGYGALAFTVAIVLMKMQDRDHVPIDPTQLPAGKTLQYVPPTGATPDVIARHVTDGETNLDALTAEIEQQIGPEAGLNERVILPRSQVDIDVIREDRAK